MDATLPPADPELGALADAIWAQRDTLEQLAFKLVALRLVLGADLRRYVGRCLDEVAAAADRAGRAELARAAALDVVADAWGRPTDALTLTEVAERAPEPWASMLEEHRDHLRALVAEVELTASDNARLCRATLDDLDDDLAAATAAIRPERARRDRPRSRADLRLVPSAGTARGWLA